MTRYPSTRHTDATAATRALGAAVMPGQAFADLGNARPSLVAEPRKSIGSPELSLS